jgi:hypothetical protein
VNQVHLSLSMYTAHETFYRDKSGQVTTKPGADCEVLAARGAVMSNEAAKALGLPRKSRAFEAPVNAPLEAPEAPQTAPKPAKKAASNAS